VKWFDRVIRVTSNPAMFAAYIRWLLSKLIGKTPRLILTGDSAVAISSWISFSEYWTCRGSMPDSEYLFIKRCLSRDLPIGSVAIDVGANVGAFTCMISSMNCELHAFEPIPETYCRLKNNIKLNGLTGMVHANCLAIGECRALDTFLVDDKSPATNRMITPAEMVSKNTASKQVVSVVSLDEYCQYQSIEHISFLKIDVEGMEPYVLRGARSLLLEKKIAAILIEVCPVNLNSVGLSCSDLYREIERARYSPFSLESNGSPGGKLSLEALEAMSLSNIVLLPDA